MDRFKLVSPYQPTGDQPEAIDGLVAGIENGIDEQVLLGVTGSGKTFTMANVIARVNRPTLVLAHNKTLAAQLCSEFKEFFPENAVEYFVSLPAGGVHPAYRHLHREGLRDKRRDRTPAPQRDGEPFRAARRYRRVLGVLHLRPGRPDRLCQHGHIPAPRADEGF